MGIALSSMAQSRDFELKSLKDTMSYAVGIDLGLNVRQNLKDIDVDIELITTSLFYQLDCGDTECEAFKEEMEFMQEFQYTRFMPYMQALDARNNPRPNTILPLLPELFDEKFTRERVSRGFGLSLAGNAISVKDVVDMEVIKFGYLDALKVDDMENMEQYILLDENQLYEAYTIIGERVREIETQKIEMERAMNAENSTKWLAEVEKMEGVIKTASGLLYRIDRVGYGEQPMNDTDIVEVHYEGRNVHGEVFDSSYERGESIEFPLDRVIKGWTEGMKHAKVGGQITLWIPAELAYGERGAAGVIGPNEALEFKVELLGVKTRE